MASENTVSQSNGFIEKDHSEHAEPPTDPIVGGDQAAPTDIGSGVAQVCHLFYGYCPPACEKLIHDPI